MRTAKPWSYPSQRTLFMPAAVALVVIAALYFLYDNLAPRTYQDSVLAVTYPPGWKTVDPGRMGECAQQPEGRRCLVVMVRAPEYQTKIIVIQQDLPAGTTLEQAESDFWNRLTSSANITLERGDRALLDQQPALLRRYSFQFEGGSGYEMSLTMLNGQTLYQVFANAEDRDVLLHDLPEIQRILDSLHFKTGTASG